MYLMLSDWVATRTATEAIWMKICAHASQVIAIANVTVAGTTYPAS